MTPPELMTIAELRELSAAMLKWIKSIPVEGACISEAREERAAATIEALLAALCWKCAGTGEWEPVGKCDHCRGTGLLVGGVLEP
jgi:hypothetical protein